MEKWSQAILFPPPLPSLGQKLMCPVNRKEMKMKRQKILIEEKRKGGGVVKGTGHEGKRQKRNLISSTKIKEQGLDHKPEGEGIWRQDFSRAELGEHQPLV